MTMGILPYSIEGNDLYRFCKGNDLAAAISVGVTKVVLRRELLLHRVVGTLLQLAKPVEETYASISRKYGYIRVLMNCFAFYICFSDKKLFSVLYFVSFVCDALDGWFARKFNQVSTFGAVLDMVTDRISTACLLVILSQIYRPGLVFLSLLALDIASHWLQMYSTFLVGKVSHKDVKDSTNWLFKAYYGNRIFMCYCCVACEVLYIILFLLAKNQNENLKNVIMNATKQNSVLSVLLVLLVVGWAIKQAVNVIQGREDLFGIIVIFGEFGVDMSFFSGFLFSLYCIITVVTLTELTWNSFYGSQIKTAADACVDYDINKKQKP
ncbi:hypothetical protein TEA_024646 [Camellia sinensis var. sinensis]|uniref:CDP-diacylglycerol--inositol 3-phosphatidyltransferase n=1 Tax=Camellia sinensis var. sinensis TaxID=542762 RepID=A0A4S4D0U6_CAMSN|nr:hypothetical protein TEA_024646 [Camellia sinensis var. sinensis]